VVFTSFIWSLPFGLDLAAPWPAPWPGCLARVLS